MKVLKFLILNVSSIKKYKFQVNYTYIHMYCINFALWVDLLSAWPIIGFYFQLFSEYQKQCFYFSLIADQIS